MILPQLINAKALYISKTNKKVSRYAYSSPVVPLWKQENKLQTQEFAASTR